MHWANFESRNLCCLQSFEVKTCFHIANCPLPIHLHSHEISKFIQILSFCSTNVVKVQVSSIFKEKQKKQQKVSLRRGRLEPGVPQRQSFTLTTRPPKI